MDNKGQVTIEALLIFGAMIIIFVALVSYTFKADYSAKDVQFVSDARYVTGQIVSSANMVSTPGELRTVEVYVPGFTSRGGGIIMTTTISTDGDNVTTIASITRNATTENYTITKDLPGAGWQMNTLSESNGSWYTLSITWRNITYVRRVK